jgi:hypothetical protein
MNINYLFLLFILFFSFILFFCILNPTNIEYNEKNNEKNEYYKNNNNNKIRILNLVLYSEGPDYNEMRSLTHSYYKRFKNVDTIYYAFSENIDSDVYDDKTNILYIKGKESYLPGILDKTIKAFYHCKTICENYDYIIRTNISTVVNFDKLSYELQKRPIDYGGGLSNYISKDYIDEYNGITKGNNKKFENLYYPSGTCMIFSRDLFENMMDMIDQVDYSVVDDVSIGEFVRKYFPNEYREIKGYNKYFLFVEDIEDIKDEKHTNYIFFRNRNNSRKKDVEHIRYLISLL